MKRNSCADSDGTISDDGFLDMEEAAALEANTINAQACEILGVAESFASEWQTGVILEGADNAPSYFLDDYPNMRQHAEVAAEELDRFTKLHKIFWYPDGKFPSDLCVCPANIILKSSRARIVHDWSRVGLNRFLYKPDVHYGTMDDFLAKMRPRGYMAGLDFKDCFLHWLVHSSSRRKLGVRHPITSQLGVFLFLPFGLSPAPGINDRNVGEVIRVCENAVRGVAVVAFVDDLRLFNIQADSPEEDKATLTARLWEFKDKCEALGLLVHEKPGKLIWPSTSIEWLGWHIDSLDMVITMTIQKAEKGIALCDALAEMFRQSQAPLAKQLTEFLGFLNFICSVLRQAQPFTREIGKCLVEAKVYQAWSTGRKRFNPRVHLSAVAKTDILWWRELFQSHPTRKIHNVGCGSFIWHHKLPDLHTFRRMAWEHDLCALSRGLGPVSVDVVCLLAQKEGHVLGIR